MFIAVMGTPAVFLLIVLVASVTCDPIVQTPVGTITGTYRTVANEELEAFLGIPYAKPPLGPLRFAYPQPENDLKDFSAQKFGSGCPQPVKWPTQKLSNISYNENCLFLNVFRKQGTTGDDKKAVIVSIHGGGFVFGASSHLEYDAGPLAALGDVVSVSINYRLGVLGFSYLDGYIPGNLGLFDQRVALEWVQRNIRSFGGNPERVTIIGVSAGSMSVNAHMVTPLNRSRKLFNAAIMDAGVASSLFVDPDLPQSGVKTLAKHLECSSSNDESLVQCLREANVDKLMSFSLEETEQTPFIFSPTVDGVFFPENIQDYMIDNAVNFSPVKTMIGVAKDEGTLFATSRLTGEPFPSIETDKQFNDHCRSLARAYAFSQNVKTLDLGKRYLQKYKTPFQAASRFVGDGLFFCPMNAFLKSYSRFNENVFVYRFSRKFNNKYFGFDPETLGVFHITPWLHFTGSPLSFYEDIDERDRRMIIDLVETIAKFAKDDSKPVIRGIEWPDYSKREGILVIEDSPYVRSSLSHENNCQNVFAFEKQVNAHNEL